MRRTIVSKKLIYLMFVVLVLGLDSSASALVVKSGETVTYDSRTRIPDGNTVVEAGGTLIFKDRSISTRGTSSTFMALSFQE
jgi:hypothetical protein